jgi:hypothetical protein
MHMRHYDRAGAIQSSGFDITSCLPHFLIFSRFNDLTKLDGGSLGELVARWSPPVRLELSS